MTLHDFGEDTHDHSSCRLPKSQVLAKLYRVRIRSLTVIE